MDALNVHLLSTLSTTHACHTKSARMSSTNNNATGTRALYLILLHLVISSPRYGATTACPNRLPAPTADLVGQPSLLPFSSPEFLAIFKVTVPAEAPSGWNALRAAENPFPVTLLDDKERAIGSVKAKRASASEPFGSGNSGPLLP